MQISLDEVHVRLGRQEVLHGISWSLPSNGRLLLAGRNGAGKTTTLRVASGAIRAGGGKVTLGGRPAASSQLRSMVALMPQHIQAVPGLSVLDQVAFAAWLGGRTESAARSSAMDALERVDLVAEKDRRPSQLSGGQLRRVGLAEAVARPAEILLLDEPTAGLDPVQRAKFRNLLKAVDKPMVVSTHQLDDADELFDTVTVLHDGLISFTGSTSEFLDQGEPGEHARRAESAFIRLAGSA